MGIRALTKQLERLSYTDTMVLAKLLTEKLVDANLYTDKLKPEDVAKALAEIGLEHFGEPSAEEMQAMKLLHKTFARKRSLVIVRDPISWRVTCAGVTISDSSLTDAINLVLDQLVAQHALGVAKR